MSEAIGEAVKRERLRQGLRQEDIAAKSGLGLRTVSKLEAGSSSPNLGTVEAIARALGMRLVVRLAR